MLVCFRFRHDYLPIFIYLRHLRFTFISFVDLLRRRERRKHLLLIYFTFAAAYDERCLRLLMRGDACDIYAFAFSPPRQPPIISDGVLRHCRRLICDCRRQDYVDGCHSFMRGGRY
jgi:hypothetical protein